MSHPNWIADMRKSHIDKTHVTREELFIQKITLGHTGLNGLVKAELVYSRNSMLGAMEITASATYRHDEYVPDQHDLLNADMLFTSQTSVDVQKCAGILQSDLQEMVELGLNKALTGEVLRRFALNIFVDKIEKTIKKFGNERYDFIHPNTLMNSRRKVQSKTIAPPNNNNSKNDNNSTYEIIIGLLNKLPPLLMRDELIAHGQLQLISETPHSGARANYLLKYVNTPEGKMVKSSMYTSPSVTVDGLKTIIQRDSKFLKDTSDWLSHLIDEANIFPDLPNRAPYQIMAYLQKNRKTSADWHSYPESKIHNEPFNIDSWGVARHPIITDTPQLTLSKAIEVLHKWRKLPLEMVQQKVNDGLLTSGAYHFLQKNTYSTHGFFYKLNYVQPDQGFTDIDLGASPRYQIMNRNDFNIKKPGVVELLKLASGKNKSYFSGHPKANRDNLILTESVLDSDSIQQLAKYAGELGVPVEDNVISLLSTVGLKAFLKTRFHINASISDKNGIVIEYTHPVESSPNGELMTDDEKNSLARIFFEKPATFIDDHTSNSDKMYAALMALGKEVTGQVVTNYKKINVDEQPGYIWKMPPIKEGGDIFLDANSVSDLMRQCKLRVSNEEGNYIWRVVKEPWSVPIPIETLSSSDREILNARVQYQMNEVLKIKTISSGFDNDEGGTNAANLLKAVCQNISIPFYNIELPKVEADYGKLNTGKQFGNTGDHNDYLMAYEVAKENGKHDIADELIRAWAGSMPALDLNLQRKYNDDSRSSPPKP